MTKTRDNADYPNREYLDTEAGNFNQSVKSTGTTDFAGDVTVGGDKITLDATDGTVEFASGGITLDADRDITFTPPDSSGGIQSRIIWTTEAPFLDEVASIEASRVADANAATSLKFNVGGGSAGPLKEALALNADGTAEFAYDVAIGDSSAFFSTLADVVNRLSEELQTQYATEIAAMDLTTAFTGDPETLPTDINTNLRDALVRVTTAGNINLNSNGSASFAGQVQVNPDSGLALTVNTDRFMAGADGSFTCSREGASVRIHQSAFQVPGGSVPLAVYDVEGANKKPVAYIKADGSASFAGRVGINTPSSSEARLNVAGTVAGAGLTIATDSTNIVNTTTVKINNDGSCKFAEGNFSVGSNAYTTYRASVRR